MFSMLSLWICAAESRIYFLYIDSPYCHSKLTENVSHVTTRKTYSLYNLYLLLGIFKEMFEHAKRCTHPLWVLLLRNERYIKLLILLLLFFLLLYWFKAASGKKYYACNHKKNLKYKLLIWIFRNFIMKFYYSALTLNLKLLNLDCNKWYYIIIN